MPKMKHLGLFYFFFPASFWECHQLLSHVFVPNRPKPYYCYCSYHYYNEQEYFYRSLLLYLWNYRHLLVVKKYRRLLNFFRLKFSYIWCHLGNYILLLKYNLEYIRCSDSTGALVLQQRALSQHRFEGKLRRDLVLGLLPFYYPKF